MKILIIGAGAIGAVTAAYMAQAGIDVTLVCKRQSMADTAQNKGLHIIGKRGDHFVKLKAVADIEDLEEIYDYCLIATKAYDLENAVSRVLPKLAEDSMVISMQNGICIDILIKALGTERSAQAIVRWSCTMLDDALYEITAEGDMILGRKDGGIDIRLETLKNALGFMAPTKITDNIMGEMYSKLIINSAITCGGAMSGVTLGKLLSGSDARRFFIKIVTEDMAVAQAMNITVPSFGGKIDYYKFIKGNSAFTQLKRHIILLSVGFKYRKLRSSSLTSLLKGGKTEVDTLNGWIAAKAKEYHVQTPVNDNVVRIIKEIEAGKQKMSLDNITEALK